MKVEFTVIQVRTRFINGTPISNNINVKHTGEVVGFISGNNNEPDKLVIADDETKRFVKVNIDDCKMMDDVKS